MWGYGGELRIPTYPHVSPRIRAGPDNPVPCVVPHDAAIKKVADPYRGRERQPGERCGDRSLRIGDGVAKTKLSKAQARQRQRKMMRLAEQPIEDEFHYDPRVAARAIDNKARKARGEELIEDSKAA